MFRLLLMYAFSFGRLASDFFRGLLRIPARRLLIAAGMVGGLVPQAVVAATYHVLAPDTAAHASVPAGKRVPLGWPAFPVGETPVALRLAGSPPKGSAWLRLTLAIDDRQVRQIEVQTRGPAPRRLGVLDLRFGHGIETFQQALSAEDVQAIAQHGLELRQLGAGTPLWFFGMAAAGAKAAALPVEFQPHLMGASGAEDRLAEFRQRFGSLASLQEFGWMEGCVLEGLYELGSRPAGERFRVARDAHWRVFVPQRDRLVYEDPRSEPKDDRLSGIETCLPFADLARRDPGSPLVDMFVAFARKRARPSDGAIQDGGTLSAEGSYTIGYPLATIAAVRGDAELAALAQMQLRLRAERLWHDGALWLRRMDDQRRTFRGWARGVSWHALGIARSIEPLRGHGRAEEFEAELKRIAQWVLPLQRADGLWACFLEDRENGIVDTSGSAGIATALAVGHRLGVLPDEARQAARRASAGVAQHLTADGLLGGVAQSNRGGEALQRSDYRVLSQMGMGLYAQLLAETSR